MTHRILFHPLAVEDLGSIDDFIPQRSPSHAIAFVRRIRERCERLATFPHRGRLRPDLPGEIRTIAIERAAVIAYRVDADSVTILRIVAAGRNVANLFDSEA